MKSGQERTAAADATSVVEPTDRRSPDGSRSSEIMRTGIFTPADLSSFGELLDAIADGTLSSDTAKLLLSGDHAPAAAAMKQLEGRGKSELAWKCAAARAKHFFDNPKLDSHEGLKVLDTLLTDSIGRPPQAPENRIRTDNAQYRVHPHAAGRLGSYLAIRPRTIDMPGIISSALGGDTAEEQADGVHAVISTLEGAPGAALKILADSRGLTANGFAVASATELSEAAKTVRSYRPKHNQ